MAQRKQDPVQDPRTKEEKPPFPQQSQAAPGTEQKMEPKADHGEQSYKGSGKLVGRTALITGADSGIGRAVAIAFAREGADVLIAYLSEDKDAQETAHWVKEAGRKAVTVRGDIQDETHCRSLVERAVAEFGHLDTLINNAAYQATFNSIEDVSTEELERHFRTNIYSMFWLCKYAVPYMKPGSAIINTSSIQALNPSPNLLCYSPTKAAIANFTKGLAKSLGQKGIRVNAVAPGPVWTPLIPISMPDQKTSKFGQDTVEGRPAQPAELAPVYVLLASNEASFITGELYGVTGGKTPL